MPKKSLGRIREAGKVNVRLAFIDEVGRVARILGKWVPLVFIARYGYLAIASLAGKDTNAEILIGIALDLLRKQPVGVGLSWLLATGCAIWAMIERRLRKNFISQTGTVISELEARIDPGRSSSQLTRRGDTSPRDR
jgi:hypothetical protein